ncbi:basic secretory protein-like protein [Flavivirga sp. 57AJ16]|uniref:basic secretory protein-like protein n=1 Tax=Flavivirga sp. 57AJ16 TaxID=3025307 RepID=UPI002365997E|nr:basic secretory protein-like protein [Flavivirga sp. 57AJ16]MDD7885147.1 basic secretory protein-like protein [Flavivirga sp. 57AJ16]
MKITHLLFALLLFFPIREITAQNTQLIKKKGISVHLTNEDPTLSDSIIKLYLDTFFKTYPKLRLTYNKNAPKKVKIKIDNAYEGVAYAHNGQITISSKWMHKKPTDADLITHEGMHIIQGYPGNSGPGWLVEGIADYIRYIHGINNKLAGWSLPKFQNTQHYTNSYRVTARFLVWTSNNYNKNLVKLLDKQLRNKTYSVALWEAFTNKSLVDLWEEYSKRPQLHKS